MLRQASMLATDDRVDHASTWHWRSISTKQYRDQPI